MLSIHMYYYTLEQQILFQIDKGISDCRSNDIGVLKESVPDWLRCYEGCDDFDPKVKHTRGAKHPVTAALIQPPDMTADEFK